MCGIELSFSFNTFRDGPLEEWWGGGEFPACTNFFFLLTACARIFFFRWNPLYEFCFGDKCAFFSVKSCFIIYFGLYKLLYIHNRSKNTGHFLIVCKIFSKMYWERRKQPWGLHCAFFSVPARWNSSPPTVLPCISRRNIRFDSFARTSISLRIWIILCLSKGGHFTRVELSEVIGLCGFCCYLPVICRVDTLFLPRAIFWLIRTAGYVLIKKLALEGQSSKSDSGNKLATYTFWIITPGQDAWLTVASYAASYHRCHIYLSLVFPEIAVVFLVESCKTVLCFLL